MPFRPSFASNPLVLASLLIAVVAAAALASCARPAEAPEVPQAGPEWRLSTRVAFVEDDHFSPRTPPKPASFVLKFQVVGGGLFGTITNPEVAKIPVSSDYSVVLDLTGTSAVVRDAARPAMEIRGRHKRVPNEFAVTPESLRMARVSLLTVDAGTGERIGYTTWTNKSSGQHLAIAWFDQPGRMVGIRHNERANFTYDVRIEKAGYQWLLFHELPDGTVRVENAAWPRDPVLQVTPLRD